MAAKYTPEQVKRLLNRLEDGLSKGLEQGHLQCLADAGYGDMKMLKNTTLPDLEEAGVPKARAQLIVNANASCANSSESQNCFKDREPQMCQVNRFALFTFFLLASISSSHAQRMHNFAL